MPSVEKVQTISKTSAKNISMKSYDVSDWPTFKKNKALSYKTFFGFSVWEFAKLHMH